MKPQTNNLIVDLSFTFAIELIKFCELLESKKKYNLANQLFRCGTSIGANVYESQHAESRADFIHKLKISSKEANETKFWLLLCKESKNYPNPETLLKNPDAIQRVLTKIITSSRSKISTGSKILSAH